VAYLSSESEIKKASLEILRRNTILRATDSRDKIYGLLGLMRFDIVPNYSKSVRDVFTEAAAKHLEYFWIGRNSESSGYWARRYVSSTLLGAKLEQFAKVLEPGIRNPHGDLQNN
jgi:hypothetical protein